MNRNRKRVNFETLMEKKGNWNYKDDNAPKVYSKPMGAVYIDGVQHIFDHKEFFKILELYYEVDEESIRMINDPKENTGNINVYEKRFIDKLKWWIQNKEKQNEN